MFTKSNQQAFTLIELISVIVVLGIVAATALPRFVNLSDSARSVVFENLKSTITEAATSAHSLQIVERKSPNESVMVNGQVIEMLNGFPVDKDIAKLVSARGFTPNDAGWFQWNKAKAFGLSCSVDYNYSGYGGSTSFTVVITESGC